MPMHPSTTSTGTRCITTSRSTYTALSTAASSFSAADSHETLADHGVSATSTDKLAAAHHDDHPLDGEVACDTMTPRSPFPASPRWAALRRRSSTSAAAMPAPPAAPSPVFSAPLSSRGLSDVEDDSSSCDCVVPTTPSPTHPQPPTPITVSATTGMPSISYATSRRSWTTKRRSSLTQPDAGGHRPIPKNDSSDDYSPQNNAWPRTDTTPGVTAKQNRVLGGTLWLDYGRVWNRYPCYRWYLLAHVCQHVGDWFVRVASLLVIERLSSTGAALAHLVWAVMLPKTLVAPLGGHLADRFDRRSLMIALDLCGAVVVLGYLVAVQKESLPLMYVTTVFRSSLTSLYYPATTGIVPLLVPNAADLQLAATMNGWAWSTMAILGGTLAGTATAVIGLQACYLVDCATFLLSALMVYHGVTGSYRVTNHSGATTDAQNNSGVEESSGSVDKVLYGTIQEVVSYLATCGFGWLVIMKASAGFVWGPEDIIGVQYATVRNPSTGQEDESATSWRTGLLFSAIGIGMLVGPTLSNLWTNGNLPRTIQRASWLGLVVVTLGWLLISLCGSSFTGFLLCTMIRTVGSGMVWVNSTVALQTLSDPSLLGRILSIEYTAYTLAEALSATITGELYDAGLSKNQLSLLGATFGAIAVTVWGRYHFSGLGAAHPRFNREPSEIDDVVSSLEVSSSILDDMTVSTTSDVELAYSSS